MGHVEDGRIVAGALGQFFFKQRLKLDIVPAGVVLEEHIQTYILGLDPWYFRRFCDYAAHAVHGHFLYFSPLEQPLYELPAKLGLLHDFRKHQRFRKRILNYSFGLNISHNAITP